jgi:hypothetical protein
VALLAIAAYLLGMVSGWTVVAFVSRSLYRSIRGVEAGIADHAKRAAPLYVTFCLLAGYLEDAPGAVAF